MKTVLSEVTETDPCISVLWVIPPPGGNTLKPNQTAGLFTELQRGQCTPQLARYSRVKLSSPNGVLPRSHYF